MKKCINCGVELEDNALFCGECGEKQPTQISAPVGNDSTPIAPIQPVTIKDIDIAQPDKQTIAITVNGVIFNLKLVEGCEYVTPNEILDFYMGETPVTQALWMILMGDNPSKDNANLLYPVTNIDQSLATSLLVKLQKVTGVKFEFPTKAQWEYAYKGGNRSKEYKYAGSDNVSEVGWVNDEKLHQVGELFANEIGLCDMDGNVDELLKDGEWASRYSDKKKDTNNDFAGIRLVVNIPVDETIESQTPLQAILADQQTRLIASREEIIQERQKKAEEESKRKAEEEARRKAAEAEKAEEESKRKAEEEARRKAAEAEKAEEDAKRKAEKEARRKAAEAEKARIKAEEEARDQAEAEIFRQLLNQFAAMKPELNAARNLLAEKEQAVQMLENSIQESEQKIADTEKEIAAFNRRFRVILMRRVDNGLFNSKGTLFDNMLMGLTGATKEQIKSWDQELKRTHRVAIGAQLSQSDAFGWKNAIEQAGGQALLENPYDDTEAEKIMGGYNASLESANRIIESAKEALPAARKESLQAGEEYRRKHEASQLELKKKEIEFKVGEETWKKENQGNKAGLIDRFGNWRIEPVFDRLIGREGDPPYFYEGICAAGVDGKLGFIDREGNWVVEPKFDDLEQGGTSILKYNGVYGAKKGDKWGLVNKNGEWVIDPMFEDISTIRSANNSKIARVKKGTEWGLIDSHGTWEKVRLLDLL